MTQSVRAMRVESTEERTAAFKNVSFYRRRTGTTFDYCMGPGAVSVLGWLGGDSKRPTSFSSTTPFYMEKWVATQFDVGGWDGDSRDSSSTVGLIPDTSVDRAAAAYHPTITIVGYLKQLTTFSLVTVDKSVCPRQPSHDGYSYKATGSYGVVIEQDNTNLNSGALYPGVAAIRSFPRVWDVWGYIHAPD